ncbi:hypothetical protein ABK040_000426 [Willaertia magna]
MDFSVLCTVDKALYVAGSNSQLGFNETECTKYGAYLCIDEFTEWMKLPCSSPFVYELIIDCYFFIVTSNEKINKEWYDEKDSLLGKTCLQKLEKKELVDLEFVTEE